ncbi:MAG: type I DNA topoisomerase [Bacteroidales bacterium]|jgi:DNA topoisomerase-1|nr:type I DNA topoisomerase [Bacteroidales bacterium]
MSKNLVIVESPAKAKTIEKFLGKDFVVKSSMGHVRDLPAKDIGIDVEGDFEPLYELLPDKSKIVNELKKLTEKAETVWLATDEDREGEAISWHLMEALHLPVSKVKRIAFHEITERAVKNAVDNPRDLNIDLVNAQQARRVLDRIVGFQLSPVLWRKVKPALSAGRVQSVAVRLIVERERDINNFEATSNYRVTGDFLTTENDETKIIKAELNKRFNSLEESKSFLETCIDSEFKVEDIQKTPLKRSPAPPFTTSTLQQEASRKLGYSVARTMTLAQQLYEEGLITYMRTDSVNLSDLALNTSKTEIVSQFGEEYSKTRRYRSKSKGVQEAHEAIRPTFMNTHTISKEAALRNLYQLIWKRTIASQMSDAQIEKTTISINISNHQAKFVSTGEVIKFDGFLKVYFESKDDEEDETSPNQLPQVKVGEILKSDQIIAQQRFSQQPYRFTEASLVKKLEELGIGRPSTYAPIISTVQKRGYVEKGDKEGIIREYDLITLKKGKIKTEVKTEKSGFEKSKLMPTDVGGVVNNFLVEYFEDILDYNFTASVEKEFDEIASGKLEWQKMMKKFYKPFRKSVDYALEHSEKASGERLLGVDPKTGKNLYAKLGRYGTMIQLGEVSDTDKPTFAKMKKEQSIDTITLEEALDLFKLPRVVGEFEGHEATVGIGRFGPYARINNEFFSIAKGTDLMELTIEDIAEIVENKRKTQKLKEPRLLGNYKDVEVLVTVGRYGPYAKVGAKNQALPRDTDVTKITLEEVVEIIEKEARKNVLKSFDDFPEMLVMKGRYGAYISYKDENYKIPKTLTAEDLTYEECLQIVSEPDNKTSKRKTYKKKK